MIANWQYLLIIIFPVIIVDVKLLILQYCIKTKKEAKKYGKNKFKKSNVSRHSRKNCC